MKKIILLTMLVSTSIPVFSFNFFNRPTTDGTAAAGIPTPDSGSANKWLHVQVTPDMLPAVDGNEWTRMSWWDFKKISRILALSAKPYRKHPFAVKVRTRKLLQEFAKHNITVSRFVLETIPAQVKVVIDGHDFLITYESDLTELLFDLAIPY